MSDHTPQLFEVQIRVRTTREHPDYGVLGFGTLHCWFFGEDEMSAAERAIKLAGTLPYKIGPAKVFLVDAAENLQPWQVDNAVQAHITGERVKFVGYWCGLDEKKTLGDWPYVVPPLKG